MTKRFDKPTKEDLETRYNVFGETMNSLAKHYGISSGSIVKRWLREYEITEKSNPAADANRKHQVIPSKADLLRMYNNHSLEDCVAHYKCSQFSLYRWLTTYNIPIRTRSEACYLGKER